MSQRPSRLVLLGDPVEHSLSPVFQNAALAKAGIPLRYEAIRVPAEELKSTARDLAARRAAGNVTVPHKRAFVQFCAKVTSIAKRVGAVNTFWPSDDGLVGDNTDVGGFDIAARSLLKNRMEDLVIAVIGAGGAAAAVLGAVEGWPGARVLLYSRRTDQAEKLGARFGDFVSVETTAERALGAARLAINATPVGLSDESFPFSVESVQRGTAVMDLVYRKGGTPLVRAASARGLIAADGTDMLIEQGSLSFERWFGMVPDKAAMRAALS